MGVRRPMNHLQLYASVCFSGKRTQKVQNCNGRTGSRNSLKRPDLFHLEK